jgi:hypothetical protein
MTGPKFGTDGKAKLGAEAPNRPITSIGINNSFFISHTSLNYTQAFSLRIGWWYSINAANMRPTASRYSLCCDASCYAE